MLAVSRTQTAARIQLAAGRALAALPPRAQSRLAGPIPQRVDGQVLDPGVRLLLRTLAMRGGAALVPGPGADPVAVRDRARRDARSALARPTPVGAVLELEVQGGQDTLQARHYVPPEDHGGRPLIVFFHGGGWVIGDLDTHDEPCRLICAHGGMHVLSVDYRLAPEHRFPAAVEDALAATRWALAHAASLGADPRCVAVAGDSAGGNLAAVVARELTRCKAGEIALQALIYPGTDFTGRTRSQELFGEGFFLDRVSMEWFRAQYLPPDADPADPRLSPLRADDLRGLPPALVVTAAFDPLRDEGEAYADALRQAGNRVVCHRFPGLIHGFINLTGVSRAALRATIALAGMIRGALPAPASQPHAEQNCVRA
jgi:acetyl esterase